MNESEGGGWSLKNDFDGVTPAERRADEIRLSCDETLAQIVLEGQPFPVQGYVINASKSGLGMRLDRDITPGTVGTVEMKGILITGSIRYCMRLSGLANS